MPVTYGVGVGVDEANAALVRRTLTDPLDPAAADRAAEAAAAAARAGAYVR